MPAYATGLTRGLYPGDRVALVNNAATDTGITATIAVALTQIADAKDVTIANGTNQTATIQAADVDANASYSQLVLDNAWSVAIAAGTTLTFPFGGPFLRCTFAIAPTTGTLSISR